MYQLIFIELFSWVTFRFCSGDVIIHMVPLFPGTYGINLIILFIDCYVRPVRCTLGGNWFGRKYLIGCTPLRACTGLL